MSARFRFETLQIWQLAAELSLPLFQLADGLEKKKLYRFAEQLRGAVLSVSNNIAEGSGSTSEREFQQFLNFSRRSVFETANVLLILSLQGSVSEDAAQRWLPRLEELSRKITAFSRSLGP
ncbi:MAG: four helix bundle protein [Methylacidiphilales bacterium]|nr:four helix bundle protein [Candidatus Methylacidiphilales bacterium]